MKLSVAISQQLFEFFYFLSSIILSNFSCCVEEFLGYGVFSTYEIIQLARIIDNKFSLLDRETQNRYKVISDIEMDYRLIRVFELLGIKWKLHRS
jgi:hypothetical protein